MGRLQGLKGLFYVQDLKLHGLVGRKILSQEKEPSTLRLNDRIIPQHHQIRVGMFLKYLMYIPALEVSFEPQRQTPMLWDLFHVTSHILHCLFDWVMLQLLEYLLEGLVIGGLEDLLLGLLTHLEQLFIDFESYVFVLDLRAVHHLYLLFRPIQLRIVIDLYL